MYEVVVEQDKYEVVVEGAAVGAVVREREVVVAVVGTVGPRGPEGEQGEAGPEGPQGPQGEPGSGLMALVDDSDPTLGADLKLNNHGVVGSLETTALIIDGGLLG